MRLESGKLPTHGHWRTQQAFHPWGHSLFKQSISSRESIKLDRWVFIFKFVMMLFCAWSISIQSPSSLLGYINLKYFVPLFCRTTSSKIGRCWHGIATIGSAHWEHWPYTCSSASTWTLRTSQIWQGKRRNGKNDEWADAINKNNGNIEDFITFFQLGCSLHLYKWLYPTICYYTIEFQKEHTICGFSINVQ